MSEYIDAAASMAASHPAARRWPSMGSASWGAGSGTAWRDLGGVCSLRAREMSRSKALRQEDRQKAETQDMS